MDSPVKCTILASGPELSKIRHEKLPSGDQGWSNIPAGCSMILKWPLQMMNWCHALLFSHCSFCNWCKEEAKFLISLFKRFSRAYSALTRKFTLRAPPLCLIFIYSKTLFWFVFQSFENLSVESGGSGLEKDDPPGKADHWHTATVLYCSPVWKFQEWGEIDSVFCPLPGMSVGLFAVMSSHLILVLMHVVILLSSLLPFKWH